MTTSPLISVTMTVYNGGRYLSDAIASILSQTFPRWELIIVDNASTDNSRAIIRSLKDPRVILVENPENLGQTKALNLAVASARGEFIARMDADDLSHPQRFELQWRFLRTHPTIAAVGSWQQEINAAGQTLKIFKVPTDPAAIRCHLVTAGNLTHQCFSHPSMMIRKQALREAGLYNPEYHHAQDYDLWLRLSQRDPLGNITQPLLYYRVRPDSESKRHEAWVQREVQQIIARSVSQLMPEFAHEDHRCLCRMLWNLPPDSSAEGEKVVELFSQYFRRFIAEGGYVNPQAATAGERLVKLLYAPAWSRTNPLLAAQCVVTTLLSHPTYLFDDKLYKNLAKRFLRRRLIIADGRLTIPTTQATVNISESQQGRE